MRAQLGRAPRVPCAESTVRRERSAVRAARRERRLGSNSAWLLYSRSCALSELALHLSAPFSPRRGDQQRTHTRTRLPRSSWACSLRPSERPSATTNTAASHLAVAARAAARAAHTPSATPWRPSHAGPSTRIYRSRKTAAQYSSLCSFASAAQATLPRRRKHHGGTVQLALLLRQRRAGNLAAPSRAARACSYATVCSAASR